MSDQVLLELARELESRKSADPKDSYVASLYQGRTDAILKKVGEEATETICLLYTSPSPRDATLSRMPSSA